MTVMAITRYRMFFAILRLKSVTDYGIMENVLVCPKEAAEMPI